MFVKGVSHMKERIIKIDRDSICMGDDCFSHEKFLTVNEEMTLISLFEYLIEYVPTMYHVIWAIRSNQGVCGYIMTNDTGQANIELVGENQKLLDTSINEIMCKYYYPSSFSWINGETGERIHKYSESLSFLEKVKRDNESI